MSRLFLIVLAPLPVLLIIAAVSAQAQINKDMAVKLIDSPAPPGSGEPNLYAAADGRVFLTWIERIGDEGHRLRFAVRDKGNWSEPRTIAEGSDWFVNWADFPSLVALTDGTLVAHWLVKSKSDTYAYNVNIAHSTDGGKSWSKPVVPHRDGTKTEHGFVSLLPSPTVGAALFWLDGRKFTSSEHGHAGHGPSTNEMTLRFTTVGSNGQLSEDVLLDPRVCDCCQTSAAMTSEGPVVVYRDRSGGEVRDISIVRLRGGRWSEPQTVSADGWEINGCPVNGPSVAAQGRQVAIAWFTAAKDKPRVKVAFSDDAGAIFSGPIQVDDGSPMGRVQVLLLPDRSALVSWLERTSKGAEIRVRRVRRDGSRDEAITIAESSAARASGFPRMARSENDVVLAWTQPGAQPTVRLAVVRPGASR
jgi:hypothetical protein